MLHRRAVSSRRVRWILVAAGLTGIALAALSAAGPAFATDGTTANAAAAALPAWKAVILGLVEGITEYLPISSTGHLLVAEHLLDVGTSSATEGAADTYVVTIQAGAILAVLVLYRHRIGDIVQGLFGRSATGRRVLVALAVAFVPAAVTGLLFDDLIKDRLLAPVPIAAAWVVGAAAIWFVVPRVRAAHGRPLDEITLRHAAVIGGCQVLALWPGTSRSLVTIIAALAVGLSMMAAVEFSFLLGLLTLTAATFYDGAKNGGELVDTFGVATPLLGLLVAFVSAVVAVRWMVTYLERKDLRVFAIYRVVAAVATIALLAAGVI